LRPELLARNVSLDKAAVLLWPIKKKYGNKIKAGPDLMILAGTSPTTQMGLKDNSFCLGRTDVWHRKLTPIGAQRRTGLPNCDGTLWHLRKPGYHGKIRLAAVQMGLIYVNPEGVNGQPDPAPAPRCKCSRETFGPVLAMDDEETAALTSGGHTVG